jgi:hypothetical protein
MDLLLLEKSEAKLPDFARLYLRLIAPSRFENQGRTFGIAAVTSTSRSISTASNPSPAECR